MLFVRHNAREDGLLMVGYRLTNACCSWPKSWEPPSHRRRVGRPLPTTIHGVHCPRCWLLTTHWHLGGIADSHLNFVLSSSSSILQARSEAFHGHALVSCTVPQCSADVHLSMYVGTFSIQDRIHGMNQI
jgi:hypothetical protein